MAGRAARALAALLLSLSSVALAAPPADDLPPIVPPRAIEAIAAYPDGADGDAVVVLELLVSAQGEVTQARVIEGPEPFAAAALSSVRSWRFEPATVAGETTAARIRFEVRFMAPQPIDDDAEGDGAAQAAATESEQARGVPRETIPAGTVLEVTVEGDRRRMPTSMSRAEVRQLPGTFGDPFRAIEAMPGVTPIVSGVPFFYVRGAPPGNVGYFLDGIRVPYLYHLALGPSVINPAIVDRVDLYPGAYPARYGRYAGGIVAAETTDPSAEVRGEANVRVFDAGGAIETPFANARGSVLLGGRYSYTAAALSLLAPEALLRYWDYQGRASYELSPRDSARLFVFGAYDVLGEHRERTTRIFFDTAFHRADVAWVHRPDERTELETALTFGIDRTRAEEERLILRDRMVAVRSRVSHKLSRGATLRAGAEATIDAYDVLLDGRRDEVRVEGPTPADPPPSGDVWQQEPEPDPREQPAPPTGGDEDSGDIDHLLPTRTDLATGVYAELVLTPELGITVTPGLRLDYYVSDGASAVALEPRVQARIHAGKGFFLLHGLGLAHQPPGFSVPLPGFALGGLQGGLQRSLQSSYGVENDTLPWELFGSVTGFHSVFLDMTDPLSTIGGDDRIDARSMGSAIGFEFLLRRSLTKRFGGFVSYTLSRSVRSIGIEHFHSRFDRTHVLNLAAAYDLGRNWRAGSRLVYYSGFPIYNTGTYVERSEQGWVALRRLRTLDAPRSPDFARLDLRLEKRWQLSPSFSMSLVFEFLNASLSTEVVEYSCSAFGCEEERIGPVSLPSIGVEAYF